MTVSSHPWLDTSEAPLFRIRFPDAPTAEGINEFAEIWLAAARDCGTYYGGSIASGSEGTPRNLSRGTTRLHPAPPEAFGVRFEAEGATGTDERIVRR